MKYATFDVNGRLSGRYDSNIHSAIPHGAIELPDELFFQTINTTEGYWELVNGTVTHIIPPPLPLNPVPSSITMRQGRLALLQGGLLSQADSIIASMPLEAQITWEFSSVIERNNPLVGVLASVLTLSGQQVDDLFILAATL